MLALGAEGVGLAAGLLHHRRTGEGMYFDLSQVEAAVYSLTPWLLEYHRNGRIIERLGNDDASGRAKVRSIRRATGNPSAAAGDSGAIARISARIPGSRFFFESLRAPM